MSPVIRQFDVEEWPMQLARLIQGSINAVLIERGQCNADWVGAPLYGLRRYGEVLPDKVEALLLGVGEDGHTASEVSFCTSHRGSQGAGFG